MRELRSISWILVTLLLAAVIFATAPQPAFAWELYSRGGW